jgi:hypothetical protein
MQEYNTKFFNILQNLTWGDRAVREINGYLITNETNITC